MNTVQSVNDVPGLNQFDPKKFFGLNSFEKNQPLTPEIEAKIISFGGALGSYEFGLAAWYIITKAIIENGWSPTNFQFCPKLEMMSREGFVVAVDNKCSDKPNLIPCVLTEKALTLLAATA